MKKYSLILLLFMIFGIESNSQNNIRLLATITEEGDTIGLVVLKHVIIYGDRVFKSSRQQRQWNKLKRDVYKVYPIAKIAGRKLRDFETKTKDLEKSQVKKLSKQLESEIVRDFEKEVKSLTLNQGLILLKLIDRETGQSSYTIVKELRGNLRAFFYQSIALLFSANLKSEWNPQNNQEDRAIEHIIISIEDGTFLN